MNTMLNGIENLPFSNLFAILRKFYANKISLSNSPEVPLNEESPHKASPLIAKLQDKLNHEDVLE